MCGLAGFVTPNVGLQEDPHAVVEAMAGSLEHRGPDDKGVWCDPDSGVFLGFRRLSILDRSPAGHQPMVSESGRYVVTLNGEIYNFRELGTSLVERGARFRGGSDTEVLLASVERWGVEGAVRRFRGMFAFALWDREDRCLILARDRMGIKPLYLFRNDRSIAWASECRAFHRFPLCDGRGSSEAAWHFLQRLYVPAPLSILEGVEKLPAGTLTSFELRDGRLGNVSRARFWDLREVADRDSPHVTDEVEGVERLHQILRETVSIHLRSDVPVGALLSGGIDSSVVVALIQEVVSEPIRTFTIRFDAPGFDEGASASEVSRRLGTRHTSVVLPTSEVQDLIPALARVSDEPMANPSLLPTLLISRVARRDVVVALSGDGGDELFGGYNRYLHGASIIRCLRRVPGPVRRFLAMAARTRPAAGLASLTLRAFNGTVGTQQSPGERVQKLSRLLDAPGEWEAYESLLRAGVDHPPLAGISFPPMGADAFGTLGAPLESRMMLTDQLHYLPDDLLAKVDRASMWESLELRVPLLDHEVVEYSWSLAQKVKIRRGVTKWPLRRIASRYLPDSLLNRPKMGFTVPIDRWLATDLREWALDNLNSSRVKSMGIWDQAMVGKMWRDFESGRSELALPLYAIVVLLSWSNEWNVNFE